MCQKKQVGTIFEKGNIKKNYKKIKLLQKARKNKLQGEKIGKLLIYNNNIYDYIYINYYVTI